MTANAQEHIQAATRLATSVDPHLYQVVFTDEAVSARWLMAPLEASERRELMRLLERIRTEGLVND